MEGHDKHHESPNEYLLGRISSLVASTAVDQADDLSSASRSELDSHANMVVLGRNCFVFDGVHGKTCDVEPFDPKLGKAKKVPVVDAAVAYDCPYSHQTFLFILRNALYIPTLEHNLIPPFIMREAGLTVNDTPKIHTPNPDPSDHSISFPSSNLLVPLQLWGTFSYFPSRMPTSEEIHSCDKLFLTPDGTNWDPYSTHFALNEESMLDYDGTMRSRKMRRLHKLDQEPDPVPVSDFDSVISSVSASTFSSDITLSDQIYDPGGEEKYVDQESVDFASAINLQTEISKFGMSVGSTVGALASGEPFFSSLDALSSEISSTTASKPTKGVTPQFLSKIWHINTDLASKVIDQSTQLQRQGGDNDLSRLLSTNDRMLRYRRINSQFFSDTFFVTAAGKSTRGFTCAQMFVSDKGFVAIYPMRSKSEFQDALHQFCKEIGVPTTLVVDPAREQTKKSVRKFCHQVGTTLRVLEESTQWANRAELYIGMFKEAVRQDLSRSNAPLSLWDYCVERRARIHNVTPKNLFQLNGSNPTSATFGTQPDISNICQFDWYEWCYYREVGSVQFPFQRRKLGRVLGPFKNEGNEMCQAVLNINGNVVPRRTVTRLTTEELHSPAEIAKRKAFDDAIALKLGTSMSLPSKEPDLDLDEADLLQEDDEAPSELPIVDPVDASGKAVYDKPFTDYLIHAEVLLPQGEGFQSAKVKGRAKDADGNTIGTFDNNPILNSIVYDVEFPDGAIKQYAANTIAENMYSQLDSDGYSKTILESIIDYKVDDSAVTKDDMYVITQSGQRRLRMTTVGWKLLIKFRDGSEQWIPLKVLKETNPVQVAEFAVARGIQDEPAFKYWVPFVLRKRDRIVAAVNSRVRKTTHKYGIEMPRSIEHALQLDAINGNTFWRDAIDKEMSNVLVAFELLRDGERAPVGWSKSSGHIIFDIKMDFTRKARWVKDGHLTREPDHSTYAGVVSRESVRIALLYAALNSIDVIAGDIQNAYLQAPSSEKHYVICGLEFGVENVGRIALIRRALYGGKSSGADFWKHLRSCMTHLQFEPCKADADIWMRKGLKDDGTPYWELVLLYVDDVLCVSCNAADIICNQIGRYFIIKPGSVGPPSIYLGNKVSQVELENGAKAWAFSSSQYVQNAVANVEKFLKTVDKSLPKRATAPFSPHYRPEIDVTSELDPKMASYYQSLIGILRWMVELGRADISAEVSMMASCMALPRQGHLDQLFHIFAYLKSKHNSQMVFDPSYPDINTASFPEEDWTNTVYGQCKEDLPPEMPEPLGLEPVIRVYVDSDHAGDSITRRSRTGFIVFLNNAPIYWESKKQGSIETSSFGSEFIAMKTCCEYVRGLRFKLRMLGIPCTLPTFIYGDNQSVLVNSSNPFSQLKKKSSSVAYHFVREGVAKREWMVSYINTHENLADLLTKPLPGGEKRSKFMNMMLHYIN